MKRRKIKPTRFDFYACDESVVLVSLGLKFGENHEKFEDVLFRVANCDSKKEALAKVRDFVAMLVEEYEIK